MGLGLSHRSPAAFSKRSSRSATLTSIAQTVRKIDPEQRAAPRMRTLIAAKIGFNNGQSALDCLIRNLSDTGAKLIVSAAVTLPECFDLIVAPKSLTRRVRIAWR